jgi:hypothetical protein
MKRPGNPVQTIRNSGKGLVKLMAKDSALWVSQETRVESRRLQAIFSGLLEENLTINGFMEICNRYIGTHTKEIIEWTKENSTETQGN